MTSELHTLLASLVELEKKATPGEWAHDPDPRLDGASQVVRVLPAGDRRELTVCFLATGIPIEEHEATADLIAALRNALPRIAELVGEMEKALSEDAAALREAEGYLSYGFWEIRPEHRAAIGRARQEEEGK